jgi:hypothetical protein
MIYFRTSLLLPIRVIADVLQRLPDALSRVMIAITDGDSNGRS